MVEVLDSVHVRRVPWTARVGTRYLVVKLYRLVRQALAGERPDVVQAFQLNGVTIAAVAVALIRRAPLIVKITGRVNLPVGASASRRFKVALISFFSAALVVPSLALLEAAITAGLPPPKLHFIPNGVDGDYFRPLGAEERARLRASLGYGVENTVFVWVGRLDPAKRLRLLVDAWPEVVERFPSARLLIVGDGDEHEIAEGLESRFPTSVRFVGLLADVAPVYQAADASVLTSDSEGLSNTLLEARACGLPSLAANVPENAEVLGPQDHWLLFDPGSATSLASCLAVCIAAGRTGSQMERRRETLARFDERAVAAQWAELYTSVLSDARRRRADEA